MTIHENEPTFACNLNAIPAEQRPFHQAHTERLMASAQEVRELPTGYAWRLPNETDLLQTVAAFISYERLCCPFFRFTLEVEPNQGPVWFSITGAVDMKAFLQSEGLVPPSDVPGFQGA